MDNMEKVNALLGNKNNPNGGTNEDWQAMYKALKAEYDHDKPMIGRAKASDARIKELEAEIAKLKAAGGAGKTVSLTPEEQGEIPDEYVGAAAKLASRAADSAVAGLNAELEQLRKERAEEKAKAQERAAAEFVSRIESRYPGFIKSVTEGDKCAAWASFLVNNAASVKEAWAKCDYKSLVYHIDRFYREVLEVRPPNGEKGGASAPDPIPHGGGKPVAREDGKKIYTSDEYDALEKKCTELRRKGDYTEYRKLRDELDTILVEGRIEEG